MVNKEFVYMIFLIHVLLAPTHYKTGHESALPMQMPDPVDLMSVANVTP